MTRRPRRNRPPRLDLPDAPSPTIAPHEPRSAGARRLLVEARVTGTHARLGREAVRHAVRQCANDAPGARLGIDLDGCTADEVRAALVETHGWDAEAARGTIDPDLTLAALRAAAERVRTAAAAGARIAIATSRPASLLALSQWMAGDAAARGADVRVCTTASIDGPRRRELWWVGDVAVVTDGQALLAHDAVPGGDDWLFAVGRPDLVVADRGFAGAAVHAGVETIAWADLDAPALAVAAARGRSLLVVPLDEQRPSAAYEAVVRVLDEPDHAP